MTQLRVVAFDPGETTGWCVMKTTPDDLRWPRNGLEHSVKDYGWDLGEISCKAITDSKLAEMVVKQHSGMNMAGENIGVTEMLDLVGGDPNTVVVLEDFILDVSKANMGRSLLTPVRIISSFGFGMWIQGMDSGIFLVNRVDPKRICTDVRLKGWGLHRSDSGPHARDATRLAFHFLRDCIGTSVPAQEKRWRAWPHLFDDPLAVKRNQPKRPRPQGQRIEGLG